MKTVGEALIAHLEKRGVDTIFGIPGVHTVEMYRGLADSAIRHITPRHEQSAGFMADGYARATGKPGVCLLITGPGVTNAITSMAQARADSVPMLVISGVNRVATHGHEEGFLHELPNQHAMMSEVSLWSHTLHRAEDLDRVLTRAFTVMTSARPGPVHIEVPLDVMKQMVDVPDLLPPLPQPTRPAIEPLLETARLLNAAQRPLILAGGGAVGAASALRVLAERFDAPVVTTTNARGILGGSPLELCASPSLASVRKVMAEADVVLGVGTQFGRTDYDMYEDGGSPDLSYLIRIDCDAAQISRGRVPDLPIVADAAIAIAALVDVTGGISKTHDAEQRVMDCLDAAIAEIGETYAAQIAMLHMIRDVIPGVRIVGDSTQAVYAGNLVCQMNRPRSWFNAATGYGALGFGAPAAIGAALGDPEAPVVCLTGDGGLQFVMSELGTAMDEKTPVIFVVWNNNGYQEIERFMVDNAIKPEGVKPTAPNFLQVAQAYGMPGERIEGTATLASALERAKAAGSAYLIDMIVD
ncbi:5-guanidino-2-oxopentanoate decarboxylase [Gymnodinialimonas hymeniacidonis]|uniref:5-guanidino-2-oxopentanoate decarboxylase n=1 Tax=Gymnodinialimonas hymeniacidonis TaxID=3126508 RepID=UPI0034C6843C